jgi:predicted DNA-binding transcriptional regulator YafY
MERLVNLLVALLDTRRPLTREELRQRVGGYSEDKDNFHRNFERDKDLLRQMGIPIVAEPMTSTGTDEPTTGYRVPRDLYELPDPGLEEDELVALNLAVSAVALEGSARGAATTALWKLAAATSQATASPLVTEAAGPRALPLADVPADDKVSALFGAVAERRRCRFDYNQVSRRVDPWRLSYRQGRWYLAGFDHGRQAERLFRVDRISGQVQVEAEAAAFERPHSVVAGPPPPWRLGDDEEVVVDLWVDASHIGWVTAMAGEPDIVSKDEDGSGCLRLRVTNREAFRGFVLGLLDHAEVLGPPEVRDEMTSWLVALARS